jgi:hypothetical protein
VVGLSDVDVGKFEEGNGGLYEAELSIEGEALVDREAFALAASGGLSSAEKGVRR